MGKEEFDKEFGFVVKYYKEGLFNTEKALRKIRPKIRKVWSLPRLAAASCIIAVIGATAALLIRDNFSEKSVNIENTNEVHYEPLESISKVIDFDDAPLPVIIEQINIVYDVEIVNIPANADEYRLSLHYEGNVIDLLDTINEILGINLEVEK